MPITAHESKCPTALHLGNIAFRDGRYAEAIAQYEKSLQRVPELEKIIAVNLLLVKKRLHKKNKKNIFENYLEKIATDTNFRMNQYSETEYENISVGREQPLVSIIMPTWNRAYVIGEAIQSVVDQTYQNWELLISDDESDDGTFEVVKSFNDVRIRYEKLNKNNGAVARNHAIKRAMGTIITFLDSDNIWSPKYLEVVLQAHSNDECVVAYTGYLDTRLSGEKFVDVTFKFKEFSFKELVERNYIDLNTFSFKRLLYFQCGGFDPILERQQDWDLITRYTSIHTPITIKRPLVLYRRKSEWSQVTEIKKSFDSRSIILKKNKELFSLYELNKLNLQDKVTNSLRTASRPLKLIAIKISAPNKLVAQEWGDFHFAHHLGKALYRLGWKYRVDCQSDWYTEPSDVAIVLRGRHGAEVERLRSRKNFLWIISHPDRLVDGELDSYDHIFVASETYINVVREISDVKSSVLHQATDPEVFYPTAEKPSLKNDIFFIGNSRNQFRRMVKWANEINLSFSLWGNRWEQFISADRISGQHIPNAELTKYYSSCKILLNDHWDSMLVNGFISNRLFDASSAGCFIISDGVAGLETVFNSSIAVATSAKHLSQIVYRYIIDDAARLEMASKARQIVLANHTFLHRAHAIDNLIRQSSIVVEK